LFSGHGKVPTESVYKFSSAVCRSGESIGGAPSSLLDMEDCLLAGCHR